MFVLYFSIDLYNETKFVSATQEKYIRCVKTMKNKFASRLILSPHIN